MARELIGNLTAPFAPEKYTDEYRQALLEIIEGKIAGQEVYIPPAPDRGEVVDLVEALKASVKATRKAEVESRRGRRKKAGAGTA
jgi:DNA end-binding protein Ku